MELLLPSHKIQTCFRKNIGFLDDALSFGRFPRKCKSLRAREINSP